MTEQEREFIFAMREIADDAEALEKALNIIRKALVPVSSE